MKGDFTRFTFDPAKRFTRVLKQQGRVDLDADWNELNDIFDSLDRTTRIDVIGVCGAPVANPGFVIALNGAGTDLTISQGRFYAHGLLLEVPAPGTSYLTQPHLPTPPALNPVDGRVDAVFLDVWERHMTAVEDPSIREVALGGPDTTTRVQTIYQVRITQDVGNATCDSVPFPPPSGGLMLASVVPVPPGDDLCVIAPAGGYRGLENRLYRIEVHDSTASGQATFKWSRDNGSIVFPVTEFPTGQPTKVRVSRLGRDQVLTFRFGDWVEVIGDESELAGVPGTLAQIVGIDEANRELTLSKNVAAHAAETHPKVRRWDQPSDAITIGPGPFILEDGLQIEFSGTDFLTGDYWTFPARTATGQIEFPTTPQPSEGITHFYCALAIVTWHVSGGDVTADIVLCPPKFPPLTEQRACCCCTVTVGTGGDFATIAEALASVATVAGPVRICLRPGSHDVSETIIITRNDVTIEGCGPTAPIAGGANPIFFIDSASGVEFANVWIEGDDVLLMRARRATALRIDHSHLQTIGTGMALQLQAQGLEILDSTVRGAGIHITDGSAQVLIRGNDIAEGQGPGVALGGVIQPIGEAEDATGVVDVRILGNRISAMTNSGVATRLGGDEGEIAGEVEDVTVAGNEIVGCALQPAEGPFLEFAVGGVVMERSHRVRVRENRIVNNGVAGGNAACGVFFLFGSEVEVDGNYIVGNGVGTTARHCLDFRGTTTGQVPNPFVDPGTNIQIRTFAFDGTQPPFNQIQGGGLNLNRRAEITLPIAVSSIELRVMQGNPLATTIVAFRADNSTAATVTGPTTTGLHVITVNGTGIVRLEVTIPQNEMNLIELCVGVQAAQAGAFQGGIMALWTIGGIHTFPGPEEPVTVLRGDPAVAVRGNTVVCPAGQPLSLVAGGGVLVVANSFTTVGLYTQPIEGFSVPMMILNFGSSYFLALNPIPPAAFPIQNVMAQPPPFDAVLALSGGFDGRTLFQGNHVSVKPRAPLQVACYFLSNDDLAIDGNQFITEAVPTFINVLAWGFSARMSGNRFGEVPLTTYWSGWTIGQQAITSLNQATHCLFTSGVQSSAPNNQIAINNLCEGLTPIGNSFVGGGL